MLRDVNVIVRLRQPENGYGFVAAIYNSPFGVKSMHEFSKGFSILLNMEYNIVVK